MKITVLLKLFGGEVSPFDGAALECALEWGGDVTVVAMAPRSSLSVLENITRLGVRAVLISDPIYAGSDTQATSYVLSHALKKLSPDLIFAGRQSMDGDTAQVPPMLAERLGLELITGVMAFDRGSMKTRCGIAASPERDTIVTFERIRTLRFPSIFSKKGTVEVWDNTTLFCDADKCGIAGSPTRVIRSYESAVGRRTCRYCASDALDVLIKEGQARKTQSTVGNAVEAADEIYYVGNVGEIASRYAKRAIALDVTGKSPCEVAHMLELLDAKIVLFESNSEYKALAARVAVLTGAGICADCISFRLDGEVFVMTRPALGGNVTADIASNAAMSFATVRRVQEGSDIVFCVGRGAVGYIEEIRSLAKRYGATLAGSRVLIDNGIMPYSDQVGITGKTVSPRVYVAFGVSGAVQHTAAISGAATVIAVNTDKNARIFDYSDYGIVADIKDLFKE